MSGGTKYKTEEVFDRFFNDSDSDIGYLSPEYESEDVFWSQTVQEQVILTISYFHPRPRIREQAQQVRQKDQIYAPHQPLANLKKMVMVLTWALIKNVILL